MSSRDLVLVTHREAIVEIAKTYNAKSIALVGSMARGADTDDSDFDFLVDFEPVIGLFKMGRFQSALEDLLGRDVDVVPRSCLREHCKGMIADAIPL